MHRGVFVGAEAAKRKNRVLILGESHHFENNTAFTEETEGDGTDCTMSRYYSNPTDKKYSFFRKIIESFGEDPACREAFWANFYFGNYIPWLCGVATQGGEAKSAAKRYVTQYRNDFNHDLFQFVNDNGIDTLVCFSRLTYNSLPTVSQTLEGGEKIIACNTAGKRDFIAVAEYLPGITHKYCDIPLRKALKLYGLRHPSYQGGFYPAHYAQTLKLLL